MDHSHRAADEAALRRTLTLIAAFMVVEVVAGLLASSLALLSDAAHMLTDVAALAVSLFAARLAARPAAGAMTYGLGRAEILSAQANGLTMLVLGALIVYGAIVRLVTPPAVSGGPVLAVALAGVVVNLVAVRVLGGHSHGDHAHSGHTHDDHVHDDHPHDDHPHSGPPDSEHSPDDEGAHSHRRSLNIEGSYRHIATDLFGFIATAIAAAVIIATGFSRADAIASLLIAMLLLHGGYGLVKSSIMVFMEAAPAGLDPIQIGNTLAAQSGVAEVHDLHVWEVTSGFPTLSAHVVVDAGHDCHEVRRTLTRLLEDQFDVQHSTLQVEHARAAQPPMQIEVHTHG